MYLNKQHAENNCMREPKKSLWFQLKGGFLCFNIYLHSFCVLLHLAFLSFCFPCKSGIDLNDIILIITLIFVVNSHCQLTASTHRTLKRRCAAVLPAWSPWVCIWSTHLSPCCSGLAAKSQRARWWSSSTLTASCRCRQER